MTKKLTETTARPSKPIKKPITDSLGRTRQQLRIEIAHARAVGEALAVLVDHHYLLSAEFAEAIEKHLLSIASTERGWRKRPEAVRKIAPELLLQKRRSMLTRVQNDLDLDRAKERASKRRQKGVKSESTGSVKP